MSQNIEEANSVTLNIFFKASGRCRWCLMNHFRPIDNRPLRPKTSKTSSSMVRKSSRLQGTAVAESVPNETLRHLRNRCVDLRTEILNHNGQWHFPLKIVSQAV